ncbi:hypothetical protein, partial [Sutterella wadsworthensis]|uniref:hypothetical protein n=1 Tax=Sutterella wadsworthensis TaxID=40545 RepID=UPI002671C58C
SNVWPAPGHCKNKGTASPVRLTGDLKPGIQRPKRLMDASPHQRKKTADLKRIADLVMLK